VDLDDGMSHCRACGYCCWNWVLDDRTDACEHLTDDGKCAIYDEWEKHGLGQCRSELTLKQATSLPDHCGYIQFWLAQGWIVRGADGRWHPKE